MTTNYSSGHQAEKAAATYLEEHGYQIQELNWKTPFCEIDIVAQKEGAVYFIEVKYRANSSQGTGLDYITPKKLKQMMFAAESWLQEKRFEGHYELGAIELMGDFVVTAFIPTLT